MTRFEGIRYSSLVALICALFLMGGASRNDVISLIVLYPLTALALGSFLMTPGPIRWQDVRTPLALLLAGAAVAAAQLVPLPPSIWSSLPGHARFLESAEVVGMAQPWRPISLMPDLTLSSLLAFLVPVTVLVGCASVPMRKCRDLLTWIAALAVGSAVFGLLQFAAGPNSALYHYDKTNTNVPTGFLANRNHQGLMLSIAFPLLALWAARMKGHARETFAGWTALGAAIAIIPVILATGSRAGLVLGLVGIAVAGWITLRFGVLLGEGRYRKWIAWGGAAAILAMIVVVILVSRDASVQRAMSSSMTEEARLQYFPLLMRLVGDYFPVGSGLGSFNPVFRSVETLNILQPNYLNHAHNDMVEVLIETGLAGGVLLILLVAWLVRNAKVVLTSRSRHEALWFARTGVAIIVMALLASLVDYPLRTPLFAALFAVAAAWVSGYDRRHMQSASD